MEELRYCKKCDNYKPQTEEFFHHRNSRKDGWELYCKCCLKKQKQSSYYKNKEKQKLYRDNYILLNKEKNKEYQKNYYKLNSSKYKEREKQNKEYMKEYRRNRMFNKRQSDPLFNLKHSLGNIINKSLQSKGYSKKSRTYEILGCSFEEFKIYLESKFEPWMTWENKGKYNGELNHGWDIDHVIPLSNAKTEEDIIKLNHYTNLQPLCSKINRDVKRDNIYYRAEKLGIKEERI